MTRRSLSAGAVFDGQALHPGLSVVLEGDRIAGLSPRGAGTEPLGDGILCPGFLDLQVNGAGGVMLNDAPTVATLARMAEALARLGTLGFLPTLITDRPETTRAAIEAVAQAAGRVPGVLGLHLEGPHLDPRRAGAHDPALIRPLQAADLALYLDAARRLPLLKITLAPESATPEQIAALAGAGVLVSLGHSACEHDTAMAAFDAGAACVTHLFNAMSGLSHRAPGLVGAALARAGVSAGIIADGVHVHPAVLGVAQRAKAGPGRLFLVSDCMAVAGTADQRFALNGREITRGGGRLTLADGTLAGADLDMAQAVRGMVSAGATWAEALGMATAAPAGVAGLPLGQLRPGSRADLVWLDGTGAVAGVWRGGERLR